MLRDEFNQEGKVEFREVRGREINAELKVTEENEKGTVSKQVNY